MSYTRVTPPTAGSGYGGPFSSLSAAAYNDPGGLLMAVCVTWEAAAGTVTVTDTAGNTYTAGVKGQANANAKWGQIFYCLNTAAQTANVIVANLPAGSEYASCVPLPYSHTDTAAFVAQPAAANGSGTAVTTAAFAAGDLAVSCCGEYSGATTTPGTGWTEQHDDPGNASHDFDRIDSPGGTIVADCTLSGAPDWFMVAMSFSDAAGGGGSTELPPLTMPPMMAASWSRR